MSHALQNLAAAVGARVAAQTGNANATRISSVFAGNKISELLHHGAPGTLLVTGLANHHLLRAAGLVEAPAICLTDGIEPSPELIAAAREHGVTLLVTQLPLTEAAAALQRLVNRDDGPHA